MLHAFAGSPGKRALPNEQFDRLKLLIRTVAHRSPHPPLLSFICTAFFTADVFRLFDDPHITVVVDILVLHGCCDCKQLCEISGLKKKIVNEVGCRTGAVINSSNTSAAGVPRASGHHIHRKVAQTRKAFES